MSTDAASHYHHIELLENRCCFFRFGVPFPFFSFSPKMRNTESVVLCFHFVKTGNWRQGESSLNPPRSKENIL